MGETRRDRWDATTLGRSNGPHAAGNRLEDDDAFDPVAPPTDGSGAVRALSLDPDRYAISEVLGEGGMGEVRRCRDRAAGRDVALKVIRPSAQVDDIERRFLREARVQARLEHPAVVPVYDVGHDVHGRAYFTMKRVEGVTLDGVIQALREGARWVVDAHPIHRLLTAFARACIAVDYAHARGVLHRDLKPANLMLGAFGEVYVLDWGLAKIGAEHDGEEPIASHGVPIDPGNTERGFAMGTPGYMAPEQAAARPLDRRADVFSLGAILFELLTLEPLLGEEEIRAARAGRAFTIDARASVRAPDRGIPPELDAICIRATASDPADRFASARALHEAVDAFLAADDEQARLQRLAAAHVAKARALSAPEVGDAARPLALEELGAALALAPDDADARAHLVHLLNAPPRATPPEVEQRRAQQEMARIRRMQRVVAAIYAIGWLVGYPLMLVAGGVRELTGALLVPAAWLATALVILSMHWMRKHQKGGVSWTAIAASIAIATTSLVWGPLFIVPGLTVAIVFGQLLVATKQQRLHIVVLKSLALAVPVYLAYRGVLDVYSPVAGDSVLVNGAVGMSRAVFYGGLTVCHLGTLIFGARFAARYRDVLDARVMENALFSWQLRNLVPEADGAARRRASVIILEQDAAEAFVPNRPAPPPDRDGGLTGNGRYTRIAPVRSSELFEVWTCHDRRLGREVELYLARTEVGDEPIFERARMRGRLEHPVVAPLYDVGTTTTGRAYFTAKLVRGIKLDEAIAALARMPATSRERARRRLLAAVGQVCLALAHSHEQGIVHGAITSEQIVLGSFGEVYLEGWLATAPRSSRTTTEAELDVWRIAEVLRAILDAFGGAPPPELDVACSRATSFGAPPSARALYESIEAFLSGDRDAEVRRALARTHLERARAAAARAFAAREAFEVQADARVEALREVGRAVRLHPDEPAATQLLFRLITEPPPHPPPAVMNEVERLRQERARGPALAGLLFGGLALVLYPVVAWLLGVKHVVPVIVVWLSWALSEVALLCSVVRRAPIRLPWPMLATMFAAMTTAMLSGPFFVTPVIATVITMSFVLVVGRGWRYATIALGSLVIVVPTVLAWVRAYPTVDVVGGIILADGALSSPSYATTMLVVTVFHLLAVLFAAEYAARFRDRLDAVETAFLIRTWQLTKLLPRRGPRP